MEEGVSNGEQNNKTIFTFDDVTQIINDVFKPRCLPILTAYNDEYLGDFEEMINSQEFIDFFNTILDLNLHMVLNDPPIEINLLTWD